MDAAERLRRYCINDRRLFGEDDRPMAESLDARTDALVHLAALVAARAPGASFHVAVDDAVAAGASLGEIVAVLDATRSIAGLPRVVGAAQQIAAALGFDEEFVPQAER
ncbi:carboxymuconolactone decarboxylase family protein [Microbacterium sp. C7(2022)]|uniref:carboxymuconolactone decarboxylase family protein n=1 Tax=Microbacterium sp. C7(2022) TaxID=2992759 RepID=UPI00237A731A|nr:carboxymuconolactone decarboxylase family protein [Microbacterium sp. C7(2022)]MDE0546140.1 carboxymuconolactone decarboxylase family protein [Microbacterium sp. C7(2022)]